MDVQKDFKELLALFNAHKVKFLIIGGYALAFHGAPRMTGDIDLFVEPASANAKKILKALEVFGFGNMGLSVEDFTIEERIVQLGVPPVRVDIVTSITGVSWKTAYASRVKGHYGNVPVFYLGREEFIANKKAIGRSKDEADIEALGS